MRFSRLVAPVMLIGILAGCVSAGSGTRTTRHIGTGELRRNQVELRIDSYQWSSARLYVVSPSGGVQRRVATVSPMRQGIVKRVTITMPHYLFAISLVGGRETWTGFTQWSSSERCLNVRVEYRLSQTTIWPCMLDKS